MLFLIFMVGEGLPFPSLLLTIVRAGEKKLRNPKSIPFLQSFTPSVFYFLLPTSSFLITVHDRYRRTR
jgi:hypothetical protein